MNYENSDHWKTRENRYTREIRFSNFVLVFLCLMSTIGALLMANAILG